MNSNQTRFGDTLEVPLRNGIYKPKQFHGRGAKIVNMGELFAHPRMRDVPMRRLEMSDKELAKASLQNGDLIFARRSLTAEGAGKCSIVLEVNEPTTFESSIIRARLDQDRHSPLFFYYFFNSPQGKAALGSILRQVAVAGITGKDLQELMVPVVSGADQIRIAEMLGALDDKIELNRRMNETLEEMARALFRDWFVDFGPTRRQMEGATDPAAIMGQASPPEKAATLAPLFPAKLGDDALPEGWDEQPFEAFVEIVGGGTPKTKITEYWGGDIPWFSVVDAPTYGAVYVHSTEKSITKAGLENSSARMVPEGTTIISARGTVGKIGMAPGDMTFNQSCYALRPKKPVGERFVFLATGQLVERLQAMAHGSVFSTITRNTFSSLSFAGADEECYSAFEDVTAPLFAKIKANGEENQTLAALRDLLLPKLMSGDIRLKDVEAAL